MEQFVAHQHQLFNKHRKKASTQRWIDECDILCSRELGVSDDKIGEMAWKIYMDVYGVERNSLGRKRRIDHGLSRCNEKVSNSLAKRKRQMMREVQEELQKTDVKPEEIQDLGRPTIWSSEKVAKEAAFQAKKFNDKLMDEAIKQNPLLTEVELEIAGKRKIRAHSENRKQTDNNYWRERRNLRRREGPLPWWALMKEVRGKKCFFIDDDVEPLAKWKMVYVDDPLTATVFIARDVTLQNRSVELRLSLIGGVLMSHRAYETFGAKGAFLKYHGFLTLKKQWFLSEGFRAVCPVLTNVITTSFANFADCKSVLVDVSKKEALVEKSKKRHVVGKGHEFIFVISGSEKDEFKPEEHRHVVNGTLLLKLAEKLDNIATSL